MHIIKGMHQAKKLKNLAENIQGPAYIITENTSYIEDIFLQNSRCLFDIEILTLKQYIEKIQISHYEFARHIYSQADLVYMIRHILSQHSFKTIQFTSNPYEMISEIISTLKKVHQNDISLQQSFEDTLLNEKCEDLYTIDSLIKQENAYWTMEEMVNDLIDHQLKTSLYIVSDDYPYLGAQNLFKKLDQYVPVTLLTFCSDSQSYSPYENAIINQLFDNTPVSPTSKGRKIIGGHPLQECMKVACDIKKRIVDEGFHYEDFLIITNQSSYFDYLSMIFEELNIPCTISHSEPCYYNEDYCAASYMLAECQGTTFQEIISFLCKRHISETLLHTLKPYMSDDKITPEEFDLFLQAIIPGTTLQNNTGILVRSLKDGLTASKKHIYLMGLNESFLPEVINDSGFLMEEDYEQFSPHPPLLNDQLQAHYFQIIQVLLNPSLSFTFSYSKKDMTSNELIPSILMTRLDEIFNLETKNISLNLLKNNLYLNHSRIENDPVNSLIDHYKQTKNQPETIINTEKLGHGVSISRLESYNKCPFSYYIKYGLKINEKKDQSLQPNELGSLCHYLMETCLEDVDLVDEEAEHYIQENLKDKYDEHPVNQYFIDSLVRNMKFTIKVAQDQLKLGKYRTIAKEKEISGKIGQVPFSGIIDRVDEFQSYLRIVDYKSSQKEIDLALAVQGFNIQMLVYLDMLSKQLNKSRAGMLYFNMKKRILSRDSGFQEYIDENDILKEYRMQGYMIDDLSGTSVWALGSSPELVAPVRIKKSGEYYKSSKVISSAHMNNVMKFIDMHITKLYQNIQQGLIPIAPTLLEGSLPSNDFKVYPCNYCPYKSVCLYDVFENENVIIKKDFMKAVEGEKKNA